MRTTLNLDDALMAEAQRLTGIKERTAVVHEALRSLIAQENARRLAQLGGTEPGLRRVPRRRAAAAPGA
ncbi:MAG: type II toxin-antitoxin system VapB family antitoxin [Gammaproteobacteria bacterium]|nr:type II toxin-antitoxin system VapB family antitoxin [Gammaproteobacteria bacterium]